MSEREPQTDVKSEAREVAERTAPHGKIVYQAILSEGETELDRPSSALFWSGLAAGLSMGFSLITEGLLRAGMPDRPWRPLIAKFGYSIGFLIVVLGRQQLFTENTLTPILPLLKEKTVRTLLNVLRLWAIVLMANLLGALIVAFVISRTEAFDLPIRRAFAEIGIEAMNHGFGTHVLRGVFAGWLLAMMVWLLPFAESGRVLVIIIITYVVALGNFNHIIAGSVDVFSLAWGGGTQWSAALTHFIIPTLMGNILGGVTLVAALNHAQVVAGKNEV